MHLYYRVHDIYFIKYVNYSHVNFFHETLQGSEYVRVPNITGFWICLWFWRCQGSEYTRVLNMTLVLKMSGFWKCQGSEYTRVLNMSGLHRVLNMPDYVWLHMPGYVWICRNMHEYAQIWVSGFCFIFRHCNQLTYFNVYSKLEVLVLRKIMPFSWRCKIWFFL